MGESDVRTQWDLAVSISSVRQFVGSNSWLQFRTCRICCAYDPRCIQITYAQMCCVMQLLGTLKSPVAHMAHPTRGTAFDPGGG